MLFNIEKCKVMHSGYNNPKADYVMDGSVLQCVSEEKDLSDDFKWEQEAQLLLGKPTVRCYF